MSSGRTVLAFVAASVAASASLAVMFGLMAGGDPGSFLAILLVYGFISLFFTAAATLVGGVPLFLLLRQLRRDSLPWLVFAGAGVGLAMGAWMTLSGGTPDAQREPVWVLLSMFALSGAMGGGAFSLARGSKT